MDPPWGNGRSTPPMALKEAVGKIAGAEDDETLRAYTSCIVGQTVYFFLSRNFVGELFGAPENKGKEELEGLTEWIYSFSMAALDNLKK